MVRGNWGELTVLINQLKILNDLLGGRGWWLVKGPGSGPLSFLLSYTSNRNSQRTLPLRVELYYSPLIFQHSLIFLIFVTLAILHYGI